MKNTYETTPAAYAKRAKSFTAFRNSERGKSFENDKMEMVAKELGYSSAEEMNTEHIANQKQLAEETAEYFADIEICGYCGGESPVGFVKCVDCGRKLNR